MSQYGIIPAIFLSFFSKKLYRDVVLNWGGKTFFYLFFLLALSWIAFTIQAQIGLNKGYEVFSAKMVDQVPVVTITQGVISTPENRPYKIVSPDDKETIAVIDTSGQYTTIEQAQAPLLVTKTEIITQSKPNETRINTLPNNFSMVVNPQTINGFLAKFVGFAWILIFPALLICSFIYRIIQVILYSIIGKIFSAICSAGLSYGQVMQIAIMALTPTIVCATVFDAFGIVFNYQFTFYFLLAMAYLFYGVIANININSPRVPQA